MAAERSGAFDPTTEPAMMLLLDITSRGARIAQCEKCAKLFYTDREKGKYCSTVCENRARALRAYYRRVAAKGTA